MSKEKHSITFRNEEHEAAFLSAMKREKAISGDSPKRPIGSYFGASLYLLSSLEPWAKFHPYLDGCIDFTGIFEHVPLSGVEQIVVRLAANFYNPAFWSSSPFDLALQPDDVTFEIVLEAFRLRRSKIFYRDGEVYAE